MILSRQSAKSFLQWFCEQLEIVCDYLTATNFGLAVLAFLLFSLNQFLDFFILKSLGKNYVDACYWDCRWYNSIVSSGYFLKPAGHHMDNASNWGFFPLHPFFAKLVYNFANIRSEEALIITSRFFFLLSIFAFIKFCEDYAPDVSKIVAGALVAFSPFSTYANQGYTEPLFLFLTCVSFCLLKRKKYLASGFAGAFLSATRIIGFLFVFSYLISAFKDFQSASNEKKVKIFLGMMLVPLGATFFILYLYNLMGDGLAFAHIQKAWLRINTNPFARIWNGLFSVNILANYLAINAVIGLSLCLVLFLKKRYEMAAFSAFAILIPATSGLTSLPRFIWWQAPLLMLVALAISKKKIFCLSFLVFIYAIIFAMRHWFIGTLESALI